MMPLTKKIEHKKFYPPCYLLVYALLSIFEGIIDLLLIPFSRRVCFIENYISYVIKYQLEQFNKN
jgi:hypothetical protein